MNKKGKGHKAAAMPWQPPSMSVQEESNGGMVATKQQQASGEGRGKKRDARVVRDRVGEK